MCCTVFRLQYSRVQAEKAYYACVLRQLQMKVARATSSESISSSTSQLPRGSWPLKQRIQLGRRVNQFHAEQSDARCWLKSFCETEWGESSHRLKEFARRCWRLYSQHGDRSTAILGICRSRGHHRTETVLASRRKRCPGAGKASNNPTKYSTVQYSIVIHNLQYIT